MVRYADRSRSLSYQSCPRQRYYGYEIYGRGVQPVRLSIPLMVGQCVHLGLGSILSDSITERGEVDDRSDYARSCSVETAVGVALDEYDKEVRSRGFNLEELEDASYVYRENKALVEALIRMWALRRLPVFLEQYEVLEVEREDKFPLTESSCSNCKGLKDVIVDRQSGGDVYGTCPTCMGSGYNPDSILWMSRADGLLRERSTRDLYVLSFKTASEWNNFKDKEARIDMQGMSELYAIEQRLKIEANKELKDKMDSRFFGRFIEYELEAWYSPKLAGVQMEFLLKGRRSKDNKTGLYYQDSYLVRPWMKETSFGDPQWAWSYWYQDEDGGNHSLGRGWQRVPIWEHMEIKEWIRMLSEGEVQPEMGDPLEGLVKVPMPYYRNEGEVLSWRKQIEAQERRIRDVADATLNGEDLDECFPQHRESCYKYGEKHPCKFIDLCFSNVGDPLESGLYQLRTINHEPERAMFEKGEQG